ncbi:hypothetical protein [Mycoplasma bradburyae]|uniref:hypothetical protein n=1 Tax=Mycoplasma bradburyae TaxID=2963128 RepID=UPI0023403FA8|nr:hypothetical protein [Mycoplasma bradburyae]MDC4184199.1 hypothetical protein [Mycoplasma bradburyae]
MKRRNILKLIGVLSVGSLLSLAAASCKDETKTPTTSSPGSNRTPINPSSEVAKVQEFINGLTNDSFSILKNKKVVERNTVKVAELTDMSFKLARPYPQTISNGWSLLVTLGQKEDTSITITAKFVKKETTVTAANPVKLTGFLEPNGTVPAETTATGSAAAGGASVMTGTSTSTTSTTMSTGGGNSK